MTGTRLLSWGRGWTPLGSQRAQWLICHSLTSQEKSPLRKVGNGCLYSWQDSYLQKLIIFYTRTWQWIMPILETAGIAHMLPASTFGLFAFVIQTCGLKTFLSAVSQSVIKYLATKNYARQSRLWVVKRSSSECRCGLSVMHVRLSVPAGLCRLSKAVLQPRLAAAGPIGHINACSLFCPCNSLSLPTPQDFHCSDSAVLCCFWLFSVTDMHVQEHCCWKEQLRPGTLLGSFF